MSVISGYRVRELSATVNQSWYEFETINGRKLHRRLDNSNRVNQFSCDSFNTSMIFPLFAQNEYCQLFPVCSQFVPEIFRHRGIISAIGIK